MVKINVIDNDASTRTTEHIYAMSCLDQRFKFCNKPHPSTIDQTKHVVSCMNQKLQ